MRKCIPGKNILEIGAGTGLPGLLAAKLGANVTLTDSALLPKSLTQIERICNINKLKPGRDITVSGLTWGMLGNDFYDLGSDLDLIIGSDCLYDPSVFEDVLASVALLLDLNPKANFICSYQLRSSDWSIENLLKKWNLSCRNIDIESISKATGVDVKADLMEDHVKEVQAEPKHEFTFIAACLPAGIRLSISSCDTSGLSLVKKVPLEFIERFFGIVA